MKQILGEIQSGDFAREWIAENRAGQENFKRMRDEQADGPGRDDGQGAALEDGLDQDRVLGVAELVGCSRAATGRLPGTRGRGRPRASRSLASERALGQSVGLGGAAARLRAGGDPLGRKRRRFGLRVPAHEIPQTRRRPTAALNPP